MLGRAVRRATAVACLLVLACYSGRTIDRTTLEKSDSRKYHLRLTYPMGDVILLPQWTVDYPYVIGQIDEQRGPVPSEAVPQFANMRRFSLDDATKIESYRLSPWKIAGLSGASLIGGIAIMALIAVATSCPTVYVIEDGKEVIAGEAYPGAIFRSVQRDDLLRLPGVHGRSLTVRMVNNNPEIQYTDSAKVLLVEHSPSERAAATHDGRAVLVGGVQSPVRTIDLDGNTVDLDEAIWQSDLDRAFLANQRNLREGLVAAFAKPRGNALELTAENTLWMSVVFQQGFSMLGSTFGPAMNAANKAESKGIEAWRAREGVDLRVEVLRDGTWKDAAVVQTPGMAALRTMIVPIGDVEQTDELQVRLTAGFGFWRIGSIKLASIVDDHPKTTVISATSDPIGEKDGRYHVLSDYGQSVDLTFELPERHGTAFLATSGWYNPLPPKRKLPQVAALNELRTTPGGLVQLGHDLYARNREHLHH